VCEAPASIAPLVFVANDTAGAPSSGINIKITDPDGLFIGADSLDAITNTIGGVASYLAVATNDSVIISAPKVGNYTVSAVLQASGGIPGCCAVVTVARAALPEDTLGPFERPLSGEEVIVGTVSFTYGDANNDGSINIADVTYMIARIFSGGPAPKPNSDAGDANCDTSFNIADVTFLIARIFSGGPAPGCN